MNHLTKNDDLPKALLKKHERKFFGLLSRYGFGLQSYEYYLLHQEPFFNIDNHTIEGKNPWTWMIENRIRGNRFDDCIKHEIKNNRILKFDDDILKVLTESFERDLQGAQYLGGKKSEEVLSRYSKYCMGIMPGILDR